ncbi:MAG: ferrous iron transport protein B, partial [Spirochaetales bacterium]|nr:ferrous iron transport protein B [Spirochaetales bacterium]
DAVLAVCSGNFTPRHPTYGTDIETRIATLQNIINQDAAFAKHYPDRWMAVKLLEQDPDARKRLAGHSQLPAIESALAEAWHWIDLHYRKAPEIIISEQRYGYIHGAVAEAVRRQPAKSIQLTEQIDSIVMHPLVGLPIFLFVIWGIFRLTFVLGAYPVALLESFFSALEGVLRNSIPEGIIRDSLVQGLIHGVGGVFSFVPLIVILFFCISLLEDTGYIARAAFLTDRFLHTIGLHGQSFMPLMLGFGCSVPAIMATRTLKSPRDRIATILAIPFISCGAKMPVYVLLAGAFFPQNPSGVVLAMYAGGVLLSIVSTFLLRRTVLKGEAMPFVMELPPYRLPTFKGVLWHVWEKTWNYTKKAGSVILSVSIAMWLFTSFPLPPDSGTPRLEYSLAGRFGRLIEPVLRPIGFDWKTSVALVPGLAAKELVVSTLGVLYGAASDDAAAQTSQIQEPDTQTLSLREALRQDPHWSPRIALALMVFVLVMPPCFASLATIRAEAGNRWMLFQIGYSLSLAWLLSFAVSMLGKLVGLG